MDPFNVILLILVLAAVIVMGRPLVALFNIALRGWIKSCRKTMHLIRN